eukprot:TRINITY_DN62648_c0_g1_i1.p1 TRINITY_DN62648_c0_g1~~TRINITY_DN62648_c0_g1_i1.p1  ORF type:complete len:267 (-),score=52.15 TRINITY_DN62648_c0_g1_i1:378-1154(-)
MDWGDAASKLHDIGGIWIACFYMYIAFCMFCVLNIMAGDFCQNAIENAARDRDCIKQRIASEHKRIADLCLELFEIIDDDGDGWITGEEFVCHWTDQRVKSILQALDLHSRDAEALFRHFELEDGRANFKDFVYDCAHLRGPARALQIEDTTKETLAMKDEVAKLFERMRCLEEVVSSKASSTGLRRRGPKASVPCQDMQMNLTVPAESGIWHEPSQPPRDQSEDERAESLLKESTNPRIGRPGQAERSCQGNEVHAM